jgi:putative cell wall-binding protein
MVAMCCALLLGNAVPAGASIVQAWSTVTGPLTEIGGIGMSGPVVAWMQDSIGNVTGNGIGGSVYVRRPNGAIKKVDSSSLATSTTINILANPAVSMGRYVLWMRHYPVTPSSYTQQLWMYDAVTDVGPTQLTQPPEPVKAFSVNGTTVTWSSNFGTPGHIYRANISAASPATLINQTMVMDHTENLTPWAPVTCFPANGSGPVTVFAGFVGGQPRCDAYAIYGSGKPVKLTNSTGLDTDVEILSVNGDNEWVTWSVHKQSNPTSWSSFVFDVNRRVVLPGVADAQAPSLSVATMASYEDKTYTIPLWSAERQAFRSAGLLHTSGKLYTPALWGRHLACAEYAGAPPKATLKTVYYDLLSDRIDGANRYAAAANAARSSYPSFAGVNTVIIASGADAAAADPLAASGLCWKYDAPLLLTAPGVLPADTIAVLNEIKSANSGKVVKIIVVGGPASVPERRVSEMQKIVGDANVERLLATGNRYDMAAAIAKRMKMAVGKKTFPADPVALIANGADATKFFDALALSAICRATGNPILLVSRDAVPGATASALTLVKPQGTVVAGGTATVSATTYAAVHGTARWAGSDRYATATTIANRAIASGMIGSDSVALASKLPDGLTGGAMVGRDNGVLLVTASASVPPATSEYLVYRAPGLWNSRVMGGTASVPVATVAAVNKLLDH